MDQRGRALAVLEYVAASYLVGAEEVEHEAVGDRSDGFHEVGGERSAGALVGVHKSEARIKAEPMRCDCGFDFENRVGVVEDGADGCGCFGRAFAVDC